MEVPLDETFDWFDPAVANDTDYPIRLLEIPHVNGLNDSTIRIGNSNSALKWSESSYDTLNKFSSVCYYFGKALHKRMAADGSVVPMGLVKNCWGGSLIEAWVPERSAATGEVAFRRHHGIHVLCCARWLCGQPEQPGCSDYGKTQHPHA